MSVTGFCWAITQWAPFSLVCHHLAPTSQFLIPFQLAEAILSHSTTDEETTSIYLEDTRSNRRSTMGGDEHGADETQPLVDSDIGELMSSRTASPEQEE